MINLGYSLCLADPDFCFKEEICLSDGAKYYEYFLLYVYDFLIIDHDVDTALHELDHFFNMKSGSIEDSNMYPGDKIRKVVLKNGVEAWDNNASKYVHEAVSNSEADLHEYFGGQNLAKKIINPFESEYNPLMDSSDKLVPIFLKYYQTHIGVLRWIVELGRIEIIT